MFQLNELRFALDCQASQGIQQHARNRKRLPGRSRSAPLRQGGKLCLEHQLPINVAHATELRAESGGSGRLPRSYLSFGERQAERVCPQHDQMWWPRSDPERKRDSVPDGALSSAVVKEPEALDNKESECKFEDQHRHPEHRPHPPEQPHFAHNSVHCAGEKDCHFDPHQVSQVPQEAE